jgi:hypothetical protein
MAGTIIADFIRTDANRLSLQVGNTTFATINASGFFSNTGTQLIAANGAISGASVIASSIPGTAFATAAIPSTKIGTGAVLQVVSNTFNSYVTSTSTTLVDSGLTLSITPSSSTSKILVFFTLGFQGGSNDNMSGRVVLLRNATTIHDLPGVFIVGVQYPTVVTSMTSANLLDSPATTSAITYKVQFSRSGYGGSYGGYLTCGSFNNTTTAAAQITAMEIAG